MKKFGKLLFIFIFIVVGLFGVSNINAAGYTIRYDNQYYEYYMTGGNNKIDMEIVDGQPEIIKQAIDYFYENNSSLNVVDVVPFKFTVRDGQYWNLEYDSATMYINIPTLFNYNYDGGNSIYLVRIGVVDGQVITYPYYPNGIANKYGRNYEIKDYSDVQSVINSSSVVSSGKVLPTTSDYFTNKVAVLSTNAFNSTGTTYYMLITCKGRPTTTTTTKTSTSTTTSTTTKTSTSTTTSTTTKTSTKTSTSTSTNTLTVTSTSTSTTIDNPKTADTSSQLYILIGAICFLGIMGLGVKFAKSSK